MSITRACWARKTTKVYAFMHEALDYLTQPNPTVDKLFGLNMKCGEINLAVMEMLDAAQHGSLRQSGADERAHYAGQGQSDSGIRATISRIWQYSWNRPKDWESTSTLMAKCCPAHGYPGLKKYPPSCRQLRRRMAGSGQGVRRISGRHSHDHKLHPGAERQLQSSHIHFRPGRMARSDTYSERQFQAGDRCRAGGAGIRRR